MLVDTYLLGKKNLHCDACDNVIDVGIEFHGYQKSASSIILCRSCAQHLARILLEDIIAYDNGTHVSLLNVMYHAGEHDPWFKQLAHAVRRV